MRILKDKRFEKALKRLHDNQKEMLDKAICVIVDSPTIGQEKTGTLSGVRVHKFHMLNQLVLLAYTYDKEADAITLIDLGSHENFYRDLKKH